MQIIEEVGDYINDEIADASKYAKKAIAIKNQFPSLAETLYRLSQEEMGHMQALHNEVEKIIMDYRKEHGDPPVPMQAVYDYRHGKSIESAKEAKILQAMYRE